ncbi:hypothetical protein GF373_04270, partial [bacterium]|nr:hypothetical protein [bacterium]
MARTHGDLESLRAELHAGDGEKMNSVAQTIDKAFHPQVDSLKSEVSPAEADVLTSAVQEPHYARRVKQTAMEAVYG